MSFVYEKPRAPSGDTFAGGVASIGDIYAASREQMIYVDNTFASQAALEKAIDDRNDEVFAATGVKPDNPVRQNFSRSVRTGRTTETISLGDAMARWQKTIADAAGRIPDQSVADRLNRSIEGDAIAIAKRSDEHLARLMASREGTGKWAGAIAGGIAGSLRDPLQVGTIVLGGGPGAGRTLVQRVISTGAKEAFINGASEAALQPTVQAWREKAGLDHGLEQALINIGLAAGLGGMLGVAGQAVGEGAAKLSGRSLDAAASTAAAEPRITEPMRQALAGDVTAARQTLPEIRETLPAPVRGALDHAEILDHADQAKPRGLQADIHDGNLSAAHRAIETAEPPAFKPDDAQIDRVVRAIAGDDMEAAGLPKAQTLTEFLAARGGVMDFQGELRAIGAGDLAVNRARRGKRDRRVTLDMAREAAEEVGYIGRAGETQVTTVADLLDAIDREKRGQPVFSRDDIPASLDRAQFEQDRAGLEGVVADIQRHAGPGVDDAVIREAAELAVGENIDAFDALERVFMRADRDESKAAIAASRDGDEMPGWSDAELEEAAARRGPEPEPGDGLDDPTDFDEDFLVTPAELEEFADLGVPMDDGRVVPLSAYMDDIAHGEELAAVVKACRA